VDYRALNAVTKADAFPIPRIDDILYNIGPADTFSVLDCFSGYLQIKVDGAPEDPTESTTSPSVERTAFSVPLGHYEYLRMPLTRLLSPKVPFTWDEEQQNAFNTLKNKLVTYPILRRPDFSKPFILHTDASAQAVGAILAQKDEDGKEHMFLACMHAVEYHSKKLTPAERNWPITHLECFAVVNAVCDHFADFLLGHPFTVYTDCAALQWLLTSPRLQGKLARWSLRLQEFMPFDIQYRKGSQHKAADAMTRHADTQSPGDDPSNALPEILTLQDPGECPPPLPASSPAEAPSTQDSTPSQPADPLAELDRAMRSAVRICIEGNIGCGKSSVMEALQDLQTKNPDWQKFTLIPEPVHEWHNLLGPLYAAPPHTAIRHSIIALLQVAVLNAYALRVPSPVMAPNVITDRSAWSSL
jgi:hypothetical protein